MYQEFLKYMNGIKELTEDDYNYLYKLYGKKLDEYFGMFVSDMFAQRNFEMVDKIEYYLRTRKIENFEIGDFDRRDPILDAYFCDIRKYPLLSLYQEKVLANKLEYLRDKLKEINFNDEKADIMLKKYNYDKIVKRDLYSRKSQLKFVKSCESINEDEKNTFDNFVNYLDIRELLVNSNLRLVVYIAHKYAMNDNLLDLIQVGNNGLIDAVENYRNDKNAKFSTYAYYWVFQRIIRYLHKNIGQISLPHGKAEMYLAVRKYLVSLEEEPSHDQIIDFIYNRIYDKLHKDGISDNIIKDKAIELYNCLEQYHINNNIKSINEAISNDDPDEEYCIQNTIADTVNVEETAIEYEIKDLFNQTFKGIDKKTVCILLMRNGIKISDYLSIEDLSQIFKDLDISKINYIYNSSYVYTLEEIGKYLGITRERVRQIESKAKKRVRMKGKRIFKGYL